MQPQGPYSRTGILSTLPNELTTAICQSLDIKSCLRFRRVCRMSHALVSGMIEYRYVIQEAANVVDAYVRTQSADHITFSELYRVMHGIHCEGCGRLGHFIYLLLMVRCCSDCLRDKPRFRTVTLASFTKAAKATETKVRKAGVQLLLSIPDHYHKRRIKLVNFGEAARAMRTCPTIDVGFGIQDMNLMSGRLKAATLLPFFDATCLAVQQIMYCEGCRFRAWHLLAEKIINMTEYLTRRRGYHTRAEFLAHFDVCFSAQRLWALSRNGKTEVEFHEKVAAVSGDDPRPNY
ncbi:hypothetical protein GE09DRAFT_1046543 [Coniochaeta sp. 2T2.1]|nr:hypothetical protein GE09DRAFT_1046543 [Coniochaeta sp. 2T2.1]